MAETTEPQKNGTVGNNEEVPSGRALAQNEVV